MKMEIPVLLEHTGTVDAVLVTRGQVVAAGQALCRLIVASGPP